MFKLVECSVSPDVIGHTPIRVIHVPENILDIVPLDTRARSKRLKDLRLTEARGYLEFVIGVSDIGEYAAKNIWLGYTIPEEKWYMLIPVNRKVCLQIKSSNLKDLYYRAFYDYLYTIQMDKRKKMQHKKLPEEKWQTIVNAVNSVETSYVPYFDPEEYNVVLPLETKKDEEVVLRV